MYRAAIMYTTMGDGYKGYVACLGSVQPSGLVKPVEETLVYRDSSKSGGSAPACCYHQHCIKMSIDNTPKKILCCGSTEFEPPAQSTVGAISTTGSGQWTRTGVPYASGSHACVVESTCWVTSTDDKYIYYRQKSKTYRAGKDTWVGKNLQSMHNALGGTVIGEQISPNTYRWPWNYTATEPDVKYTLSKLPSWAEDYWTQVTTLGKVADGYANAALRSAYLNALDEIPEGHMNSVANVLDIVKTLGSFLQGPARLTSSISKAAADAWLSTRYALVTSVYDIHEYADVTQRLVNAASLERIHCNGFAAHGDWSAKVGFTLDCSSVIPDKTRAFLQDKYGFKLGAYNAWDLVPYSFIVDWFINIGDFLEWAESNEEGLSLKVTDCWASLVCTRDGESVYFRFPYKYTRGIPASKHRTCSKETFLLRVTDLICLMR